RLRAEHRPRIRGDALSDATAGAAAGAGPMTVSWFGQQLQLAALDARVVLLPLLFGFGLYLVLTTQPLGRPKPDLGERLRMLDVEERIRLAELGRYQARPLFASHILENMLRPVIDDAGRLLREGFQRLGLTGGRELEAR